MYIPKFQILASETRIPRVRVEKMQLVGDLASSRGQRYFPTTMQYLRLISSDYRAGALETAALIQEGVLQNGDGQEVA